MIPEQTLETLANGFGHLGSADTNLKSAHTDTLSTDVNQAKGTVTCFVLGFLAGSVLENFRANGRVSYFVALPSHEAYQFKGQFIGTRELTEDDLYKSEKFRDAAQEYLTTVMGIPAEPLAQMFGMAPDLGVTFKVEKIYKQTPGPEAGRELAFK